MRRSISSDSDILRGLASISVTLATNCLVPACTRPLPPGRTAAELACAEVRIVGLQGSATASTSALPLAGPEAWMFTGQAGVWDQGAGELVITVKPGLPILAASLVRVSFALRNGATAAGAEQAAAAAGGAGGAGVVP